MRSVTDANFDTQVLQVPGPIVVIFSAAWCGPCRVLSKSLTEIEASSKMPIAECLSLEVDKHPTITQKLHVNVVPTLLVFREGKVVAQRIGALPRGELEVWLRDALTVVPTAEAPKPVRADRMTLAVEKRERKSLRLVRTEVGDGE